MNNVNWNENNTDYWDNISIAYEGLYSDEWSILENKFIQEKLLHIVFNNNKVLDLGCGLCLGFDMLNERLVNIEYTGVDISSKMVDKVRNNKKNIKIIQSPMSCLKDIPSNSFDVVMSIFTSFSYTDDIQKTITEIKRVLKKGGRIFISVLSKWSLRRISKLKFCNKEKYKTRNTNYDMYSNSWVFSLKSLRTVFEKNNFENIQIFGYNFLFGLMQKKILWRFSLFVSNCFVNLSHELILTAKIK